MQKLKVPRYIQWISLTGVIFLLIMSLLRLAITWIFPVPADSGSELLPALLLGLRYDLRVVCIAALVLFIIGSFHFLHPLNKKAGRNISKGIWILFSMILVVFYLVDFTNYAYLSQRMNANLLNYLLDTGISLEMVWQSYPVGWMIIAIIAFIGLFAWIIRSTYNHVLSKPSRSTRGSRIGWGIAFFLLLALGIFGRAGQYPLRWSDAYGLGDDYQANLALNPMQSFFSSLKFRHSGYDASKLRQFYPWLSSYLGVDRQDSSNLVFARSFPGVADSKAPKNVVIVICESFSGYKSSMYGNPLNTTPYFDSLSKQGLFFSRCFTPHYGTARGVWALITGIPDVSLTKTASRNPAAVDQRSIINDFKDHEKFYFIGGSTSWANIRGLLTNNIHGLKLYEEEDYSAPKEDVWGISDKNLFLESNKILASQQKPFVAIIQTAGNHRPYTIPEEDRDEFILRKVSQDSLNKFGFATVEELNAFRYTDFTIRKFMEAASREKYFENTLFIFVGDHGIRGDAGDMFPVSWTEQGLTTVHVPLLFYYPKGIQPGVVHSPSSQLDILPTAAGICGIPYTNTTLGTDLRSGTRGRYAFIMDPDIRQVGVLDSTFYYNYKLNSGQESFTPINDNRAVKVGRETLNEYHFATEALYEASRYLLLNNKKSK